MDLSRKTHMLLVRDNLKFFGPIKTGVDQDLSGSTLRADISNDADITAVRQFSEILQE